MQLLYRFRLYPDSEEERKLLWTLEQFRFIYNHMLVELNEQRRLSMYELKYQLPLLKKYPELRDVYSQVLQDVVYRLFRNLESLSQEEGEESREAKVQGEGWLRASLILN